MPQLLFVDACVRGAESRSRMLAERFLSSYAAANPDTAILHRDLMRDRLEPQYPEVLARRDALAAAGKLDDPLFADAWQFARADRIVLAAPFWELSFPAILKIYLERVSMRDITFGYEESGLVGRGKAAACHHARRGLLPAGNGMDGDGRAPAQGAVRHVRHPEI